MSAFVLPAGKRVAPKFWGFGAGMTSEQSVSASMSWPSVAIAVKMNWKSSWSFVWLSVARVRINPFEKEGEGGCTH